MARSTLLQHDSADMISLVKIYPLVFVVISMTLAYHQHILLVVY